MQALNRTTSFFTLRMQRSDMFKMFYCVLSRPFLAELVCHVVLTLAVQSSSACQALDDNDAKAILQIPGKVMIKEERIEFMAVAAEIQPAAFVGMTFLGTFYDGQVR
jgi:hypothetical protein